MAWNPSYTRCIRWLWGWFERRCRRRMVGCLWCILMCRGCRCRGGNRGRWGRRRGKGSIAGSFVGSLKCRVGIVWMMCWTRSASGRRNTVNGPSTPAGSPWSASPLSHTSQPHHPPPSSQTHPNTSHTSPSLHYTPHRTHQCNSSYIWVASPWPRRIRRTLVRIYCIRFWWWGRRRGGRWSSGRRWVGSRGCCGGGRWGGRWGRLWGLGCMRGSLGWCRWGGIGGWLGRWRKCCWCSVSMRRSSRMLSSYRQCMRIWCIRKPGSRLSSKTHPNRSGKQTCWLLRIWCSCRRYMLGSILFGFGWTLCRRCIRCMCFRKWDPFESWGNFGSRTLSILLSQCWCSCLDRIGRSTTRSDCSSNTLRSYTTSGIGCSMSTHKTCHIQDISQSRPTWNSQSWSYQPCNSPRLNSSPKRNTPWRTWSRRSGFMRLARSRGWREGWTGNNPQCRILWVCTRCGMLCSCSDFRRCISCSSCPCSWVCMFRSRLDSWSRNKCSYLTSCPKSRISGR